MADIPEPKPKVIEVRFWKFKVFITIRNEERVFQSANPENPLNNPQTVTKGDHYEK